MLKAKLRFRPDHRDHFRSAPPWRLTNLFVNLTDCCNLRCCYCHSPLSAPGKTLPPDLLRHVIDQAAAMGGVSIILTGGEPLGYPWFEEALDLCRSRGLTCKIATNGVLLDEGRVEMLARQGVRSLQVSLDTLDPAVYSRLKGVGPEVHRLAVDGVRRCLQGRRFHVVVSAVAQPALEGGLTDLLQFCHDEGVDTFTLYRMIPYGRASGAGPPRFTETEFQAVLDALLERFAALERHWAVDLGFPWAEGSALLRRWSARLDVRPVGCIAGKNSMTVLADGAAVPCVCLGHEAFACGNVRHTALEALWNAPVMDLFRGGQTPESCAGCPVFDFCRGGCRTLAYLETGRKDAPDPACRHWVRTPAACPSAD